MSISRRISAIAFGLAALAPAASQAAPQGAAEKVSAAKKSKQLVRVLRRGQLRRLGLSTISPAPGVQMDFQKYIQSTGLTAHPNLKPLMAKAMIGVHVAARPKYREQIIELADRFVIDRQLTVQLTPGTCSTASLPSAVAQLCFSKNPTNKKPKGLGSELAEVRGRLAKRAGTDLAAPGVTVAQARKMNDEDLVGLILDEQTRTIRYVSVVPKGAVTPGPLPGNAAQATAVTTNLVPADGEDVSPTNKTIFSGLDTKFDTDYFLTGFTLGNEIDDSWELTLANENFWHDRYFVRVDYQLGLGIGLRFPFSVDVEHASKSGSLRHVSMKLAPVNVDENGSPAYEAVGLPKSKRFGGKELVLELVAGCRLQAVIPGPDIDQSCPKVDFDFSRDVDPVIGDEVNNVKDFFIDGKVTGLALELGVASASLDVGAGIDITKGRIGVKVAPLTASQIQGLPTGHVFTNSRNALEFDVKRTKTTPEAGFRLLEPRYGFDVRLAPKLRAKVGVDVWVYENDWTLGPYALDFLSISQSFMFGHHDGTVKSHDFPVFKPSKASQTQAPKGPTTGGSKPPPPKPKQPTKPKQPPKIPVKPSQLDLPNK